MKGPDRGGSFAYQTIIKLSGMAVESTIIFNGANKVLSVFVPPECAMSPSCTNGIGLVAFGIAVLVTGVTPAITRYLTRGGNDN